jgi:DNA-binding transcriptional LysR family regulator
MFSFRQIEAFRATMETGSVSAASRLLHTSQPSLSRLISDLETELGFSLFIRQRREISRPSWVSVFLFVNVAA